MKKNAIYALMSAIALTGAVGISSCSSEDEVINNPDYNPETDVVKTQFSISLPSYVNAANTRQSATSVQKNNGDFRGMSSITLVPFASKPVQTTDIRIGNSNITLGDIAASGVLKDLTGTTASKYKVYSNVSIPIGTSAFLFYAKAIRSSAAANFDDGVTNMVDPTGDDANTANYTFSLEPIYDATTTTNTKGNNIATYLTGIAQAEGWSTEETDNTLKDLYTKFTSLTAGSSDAIQRTVTDVWNIVTPLASGTNLASKIKTAIENATYTTVSGTTLSFQDNVSGYPANLKLPDGAAALKFDGASIAFTVDNDGTTVPALTSYVYPAELWYRANTTIQVSNSKQANAVGEYAGKSTWDEDATTGVLYLYDNGSVSPSTRSVALEDVIQYAVGRLDVTVKCENGTLYDYNGDPVTVNASGFPVSAILIGGQKAVDFQFSNPSGTEYTIYDNAVSGVAAKNNAEQGVNYTMALETEIGTDVNIAIELTNNSGDDFIGKNGQLIPANGKFYLTAKLTAEAATETDKRVFKQDFYTIANLTIQKGKTSAQLVAASQANNTTGLATATNTIPDLRTPKLELGMAVDLSWIAGHTYNIYVGGTE